MCSLEKRGRVFVLTLTGAGEHRLSTAVLASLRSALARARDESSAKGSALVTVGEGPFFSNGFDLAWAQSAASPAEARARLDSMVALFAPVIADLISLPMPTVAAVTGHAAAAGFILAISHDYALMRADRGVLYMSEMDLGLPFPPYFLAVMRSKIADPRTLRDVAMGAKKVRAREAAERGIVERACGSAEETVEAAVRLAEELAGRNWDGGVYASIRKGAFPEICKAVGVEVEVEEEEKKPKALASKL